MRTVKPVPRASTKRDDLTFINFLYSLFVLYICLFTLLNEKSMRKPTTKYIKSHEIK